MVSAGPDREPGFVRLGDGGLCSGSARAQHDPGHRMPACRTGSGTSRRPRKREPQRSIGARSTHSQDSGSHRLRLSLCAPSHSYRASRHWTRIIWCGSVVMRVPIAVLVACAVPALASSQSLGDAARSAARKRAPQPAAQPYTDDDLKARHLVETAAPQSPAEGAPGPCSCRDLCEAEEFPADEPAGCDIGPYGPRPRDAGPRGRPAATARSVLGGESHWRRSTGSDAPSACTRRPAARRPSRWREADRRQRAPGSWRQNSNSRTLRRVCASWRTMPGTRV